MATTHPVAHRLKHPQGDRPATDSKIVRFPGVLRAICRAGPCRDGENEDDQETTHRTQVDTKKATVVQFYPRGGQGNSDKVRKQR